MALTYDQITAITRKHWMPKFPQLAFDQSPIFKRLAAKGTKVESGERIMQPLMYQFTKGGAYDPHDTFDVSAEDQITAAYYYWKYYEFPITISRDEILKNQGKEGVKKLLNAKMKGAQMKAVDKLSTDLFAIGSSAGYDTSTALNSLENLCNDADDSFSALPDTKFGGIAADTYSWWNPVTRDGNGNGVGPNYIDLNKLFYLVADGSIQPTALYGHNNSVASYMSSQQSYQRYMKQSDMDSGFLAVEFNGKPFYADLHVSDAGTTTEASNRLYMLNEDYLDLVTHRDENFRLEPFAKPIDQAVSVAHIMWAGEFTTSDRSRHLCLENFDSLAYAAMTIT